MADAASDLIPYLVHGFANWLRVITPIAVPLMEITAGLLELSGPILPVLVPLVFGLGAAFKTWSILQALTGRTKSLFGLLRAHPIGWVVLAVYGLAKAFGTAARIGDS